MYFIFIIFFAFIIITSFISILEKKLNLLNVMSAIMVNHFVFVLQKFIMNLDDFQFPLYFIHIN